MAGSTTNLSLIKPTYSEDADIADINTNMDTLDSKIGPVGGTSLQAQVSKILPVISGTTNNSGYAISAGEYFEANGALYKASASIPTGNAWSSSATAQSDHGAVNALNTALSPLISDAISVSDCNNAIDQNKVYYCNSTAAHSPGAYYYMIRPLYKSGNYITQIATGMNAASPTIMIRSCVNGTWGSWDELALNSKIALEGEVITGTLINSSITVSSAYLRRRNGIAEILLEGTANANIAAWSNLLSGINTGYVPFQSNEAFFMEIGSTIYPANFNSSGILNTPQAITSGQKIRFRAVYFIYNP